MSFEQSLTAFCVQVFSRAVLCACACAFGRNIFPCWECTYVLFTVVRHCRNERAIEIYPVEILSLLLTRHNWHLLPVAIFYYPATFTRPPLRRFLSGLGSSGILNSGGSAVYASGVIRFICRRCARDCELSPHITL